MTRDDAITLTSHLHYRPLSLYARRVTTLLTPLLLTTGPRARREREPEGPGREEEKSTEGDEVIRTVSLILLSHHFTFITLRSLSLPTPYGHLLSLVTSVPSVPYGVYGVGRRDEPR